MSFYENKYKKYKMKYIKKKQDIINIADETIDMTKILTVRDWKDEHYLLFLNIVLIGAGIRKCYLHPGNLRIPYDKKHVDDVIDILTIDELKYLNEMIEMTEQEMYLYDDESNEYKQTTGILLKQKGIDVNFDKMGLGFPDKIDEKYIGEMLGFGKCSGQFGTTHTHELLSSHNGITFMSFLCDNANKMLVLDGLYDFIKSNKYLKFIFNNGGTYFYYIINRRKHYEKVVAYNAESIGERTMRK